MENFTTGMLVEIITLKYLYHFTDYIKWNVYTHCST